MNIEPFVKNFFLDDHKQQLVFWNRYKKLKSKALTLNPENIRDICSKLEHNLNIHFDSEEVLYERYYAKNQNLQKLIGIIRAEHKRMLYILHELNDIYFDGDVLALLNEFDKILKGHIVLEETTLYPAIDSVLDEKDRKEINRDLMVHCSGYDVN